MAAVDLDSKQRKVINLAIFPHNYKGTEFTSVRLISPSQLVASYDAHEMQAQGHSKTVPAPDPASNKQNGKDDDLAGRIKAMAEATGNPAIASLQNMLEQAKQTTRITANLAEKVASPGKGATAKETEVPVVASPGQSGTAVPGASHPNVMSKAFNPVANAAQSFAAGLQAAQEQAARATREAQQIRENAYRLSRDMSAGLHGQPSHPPGKFNPERVRERHLMKQEMRAAKAEARSARAETASEHNRIKMMSMHEATEQRRAERDAARKEAQRAQRAAWQEKFSNKWGGLQQPSMSFEEARVQAQSSVSTKVPFQPCAYVSPQAAAEALKANPALRKPDMSARVDEGDSDLKADVAGKVNNTKWTRPPVDEAKEMCEIWAKGMDNWKKSKTWKPSSSPYAPASATAGIAPSKPRMATPEEEEMIAAYEGGMKLWTSKKAGPTGKEVQETHLSIPSVGPNGFHMTLGKMGEAGGAPPVAGFTPSTAAAARTNAKVDALKASFEAFSANFQKSLADVFGAPQDFGEDAYVPMYADHHHEMPTRKMKDKERRPWFTKMASHPDYQEKTILEGEGEKASSPAASATVQPALVETKVKHNATCDICDKYIEGARHKCLSCPDWDCCTACFESTEVAHPGHSFAILRNTGDLVRPAASRPVRHAGIRKYPYSTNHDAQAKRSDHSYRLRWLQSTHLWHSIQVHSPFMPGFRSLRNVRGRSTPVHRRSQDRQSRVQDSSIAQDPRACYSFRWKFWISPIQSPQRSS